jgi:Holliday junction resolvase
MKSQVKEKWVKTQVVKMLKDRGAYYFYPVANGYMSTGVPDIVACYKGAFLGIECKVGTNKPTVIQERNLSQIRDNEGIAMVVNDSNLIEFENFLKHMETWK